MPKVIIACCVLHSIVKDLSEENFAPVAEEAMDIDPIIEYPQYTARQMRCAGQARRLEVMTRHFRPQERHDQRMNESERS